ncbi:hypothetical protein C8034_v003378 [Colletotrichum sidae]|uniref:Uncharacterized protein n=1 Tax=Colletotrichum sidae TaxID=1347389 RepID=A0A4R8TAL4_9PEZI|nr:hypothetical protein C8034_v003378 [Colletotrichum sidae]
MTDDARKPGLEAPSRWALTSAPRPIPTTTPQGPATARCRSRDVSCASDLMGLDDSSAVLPPIGGRRVLFGGCADLSAPDQVDTQLRRSACLVVGEQGPTPICASLSTSLRVSSPPQVECL